MQRKLFYKLSGLVVGILLLNSCANKPDVLKQNKDCLTGKIHKIG